MSKRHGAGGDDRNTLSAYLREIAKLPRVTVEEERALGLRIREGGDDRAVTELVEANLRFVVSYAKRYRGCGMSFLDRILKSTAG